MKAPRQRRDKQVRLTTFDNEPMARLAEQRLKHQGIPCLIRSLQGGPGVWGSAYNLPHGLYVYQSDEMRAREVLDLTPQEVIEREGPESSTDHSTSLWIIAIIVAIILALVISAPSVAKMF